MGLVIVALLSGNKVLAGDGAATWVFGLAIAGSFVLTGVLYYGRAECWGGFGH